MLKRRIAALIPALFLAAAPAARVEGWAITATLTTSAGAAKVVTFKFAGDKIRLEPDLTTLAPNDPSAPQMLDGAFLIAEPGRKAAFIMPGMNMAMRMNGSELHEPDSTSQKCESVTIENLGVGEAILGIATRKFRMRMRLLAKGDRPAGDQVEDIWVATSTPGTNGAFKRFANAFGTQAGISNCPEQLAKFPEGFPLRVRSTKPGPNGAETADFEVTVVRKHMFGRSGLRHCSRHAGRGRESVSAQLNAGYPRSISSSARPIPESSP